MSELTVTRGLPACGKTTRARAWVAEDRARRARDNRDDLRDMLDDGQFVQGVTEARVLAARDALILALLAKGLDVICDDTNLPAGTAWDLKQLAAVFGAEFTVIDMTDVPLALCMARDADRAGPRRVGRSVIRGMQERYLDGQPYPLPVPGRDPRRPEAKR